MRPPRAKVTDFGLSAIFKGESLKNRCGTPSYMAPEVAAKKAYDASADMYSFGAVIWFVATASHPSIAGAEGSMERMKSILGQRLNSVAFRELCVACLHHDKLCRPSAAEAFAMLTTTANDMSSALSEEANGEATSSGPNGEARIQL
eukprot:TRINITY_DN20437_c0_g1_i1.p1 TRINITY_DN20437_c0_g1~~TRINITY_DN20437_c0_g1_i1.p1  ORF type:complete len:158 (-),score=25.01 TRINITY_DN20437_c0_g1_i1:7-447(-)